MKVFKFGGASVKDGQGIKNLCKIVSKESGNLIIVVSAFGKTTNALEKVLKAWISGNKDYMSLLDEIYRSHSAVSDEIFEGGNPAKDKIDKAFGRLKEYLSSTKITEFDFDYDQVVSFGEIWSTIIVSEYLIKSGLNVSWIDIREKLITDERYRDANVLWEESADKLKEVMDFSKSRMFLTQGFIGGSLSGNSTTLGREGSDYTAAILGNIFDAEQVVVWKDVPGVLNADPAWLPDAIKLNEISYKEAVEMTFSGAKVIHPKTIKPLHNKNIPLFVRSFLFPDDEGTVIKSHPGVHKFIPVFIRKEKQLLISVLPKDFSFVMGDNLGRIFHLFLKHKIKVNLVEASAVSLDVCVDDERVKVNSLFEEMKEEFATVYNDCVEILSVRHYTAEAIERITAGREILVEQRTRSAVRFVVRTPALKL